MLYLGLYVHSVIGLCYSLLFTSTSSKHFVSAFGCDGSNPCGHVGSGILVQVTQHLGKSVRYTLLCVHGDGSDVVFF